MNFSKTHILSLYRHQLILLFFVLTLIHNIQAHAHPADSLNSTDNQYDNATRARFDSSSGTLKRITYSPLTLSGGSRLTLVSPIGWDNLAEIVSESLREIHYAYSRDFGTIPALTTSVRLLDQDSFFAITSAPRWTNAMYFRGQIFIPINDINNVDQVELIRSVRHEYSHALTNALTAGRCPGWLDEGLAQLAEGNENPAFAKVLARWLDANPPVPLLMLKGGFTKLHTSMVAPTYAQAQFAAHAILNSHGRKKLAKYFEGLRSQKSQNAAFEDAFNSSLTNFEVTLQDSIQHWQKNYRTNKLTKELSTASLLN